MIRFSMLASGSSGNCSYCEIDGKGILLDVGIPYLSLVGQLAMIDRETKDIESYFVSHHHGDHLNPSTVKKLESLGVYAETKAKFFRLQHDVTCTGISLIDRNENQITYIVDTGSLNLDALAEIEKTSLLVIEANHDADLIEKTDRYNDSLKQRIKDNHLSNRDVQEALSVAASSKLEHVVLHHLSAETNLPLFALQSAAHGCRQRRGCLAAPAIKIYNDFSNPSFITVL